MALNQEQLEKQGIYEATGPLAALTGDLEQIGTFAELAAARKKKHARIGGYTMLGGLIAAVIGAIAAPALLGLGILAMIGGLFWWIYSFFAGGKLVGHPVRLKVAQERIAMLQQDASAKAAFTVRLVLDSKPEKLRDEPMTHRKNGKQEFFAEKWLSLKGPLLDGTYVCDEVTELTRKRSYKNPRGKSKMKSRVTNLVNVRLAYPSSVYGDVRGAEKALHNGLKVGKSAMLRAVRVNEKAIVMKALVMADKEITQTMVMLSLGGYRILNLARKAAGGVK